MTAKAKVDLEIRENRYQEFTSVLKELMGYEGPLELYGKEEQLAQKFASFFPEQTSEQERVAAFLSQDVTQIRQDFIQTFSPPPEPKRKNEAGGNGNEGLLKMGAAWPHKLVFVLKTVKIDIFSQSKNRHKAETQDCDSAQRA